MKKLKVNNIVGYPSLTKTVRDFAKANDALLILYCSRLHTLTKQQLRSPQLKIVIDGLPALRVSRIPLLGYACTHGLYRRQPLVVPEPQVVTIRPQKQRRVSPSVFTGFLKSANKRDFLNTLKEGSDEYSVALSFFDRNFQPSLEEPILTRKKNAD